MYDYNSDKHFFFLDTFAKLEVLACPVSTVISFFDFCYFLKKKTSTNASSDSFVFCFVCFSCFCLCFLSFLFLGFCYMGVVVFFWLPIFIPISPLNSIPHLPLTYIKIYSRLSSCPFLFVCFVFFLNILLSAVLSHHTHRSKKQTHFNKRHHEKFPRHSIRSLFVVHHLSCCPIYYSQSLHRHRRRLLQQPPQLRLMLRHHHHRR